MALLVTYPQSICSVSLTGEVLGEWSKPSESFCYAKVTAAGHLVYRDGESIVAAGFNQQCTTLTDKGRLFASCERQLYCLTRSTVQLFQLNLVKTNEVKVPSNRTCIESMAADKSILLGCGDTGQIHRVSTDHCTVVEIKGSFADKCQVHPGIISISPILGSSRKVGILRGKVLDAGEATIIDINKGTTVSLKQPRSAPLKAFRSSPVNATLCFTTGYDQIVRLYDTNLGKMLNEVKVNTPVQYAEFIDGHNIAITSVRGGLFLLDLRKTDKLLTLREETETKGIESVITIDHKNRAARILNQLAKPKRNSELFTSESKGLPKPVPAAAGDALKRIQKFTPHVSSPLTSVEPSLPMEIESPLQPHSVPTSKENKMIVKSPTAAQTFKVASLLE